MMYIWLAIILVSNAAWLITFLFIRRKFQQKQQEIEEEQTKFLEEKELELGMITIQSSMLRDIVQQYLPKIVWKKAEELSYEGMPEFENEMVEATFLFLDIAGFTRFADNKPPGEVMGMLNETLDPMIRAIYDHDGDIDKFIGDACFAIFNEPMQAVKAALVCREAAVNNRYNLPVRFGIHTGNVIRGNIGNEYRRDNTMIGRHVNVAARLETAAKSNSILISEAVASQLDDEFILSKPYRLKAKGVSENIRVFYLEGNRDTAQ